MILADSQYVDTAVYLVFMNNKGGPVIIDKCDVMNNDTAAHFVTLWIVPPNGSPDNSNRFMYRPISPLTYDNGPEIVGREVSNNGSVWAQCDAASAVAFALTGRLRSQ